ncbi:MAG: manganese efflux pump [Bacillota bacterium]|nr:hypothetical protein [Candidatus Fermentithermobacillaceae bacterium]
MGLWQWFLASAGVVFASSLDGFMAGMAYAIKGLRIRPHHYWIIGICTGTMMGISMFAGGLMALAMPDGIEGVMGGAILVGLGIWQLAQKSAPPDKQILEGLSSSMDTDTNRKNPLANTVPGDLPGQAGSVEPLTATTFHRARIVDAIRAVLAVFKEPLKADRDLSGDIDIHEAWVLSAALGLDAFAAGLGASVAGFPVFVTAVSALASPAFVYLGIAAGKAEGTWKHSKGAQAVAGVILIGIGFAKVLGFL